MTNAKLIFGRIMAFGPGGTREGRTSRKRLVSVSATPAHGRNVEANVPPTLETKNSGPCLGWGGLTAHKN